MGLMSGFICSANVQNHMSQNDPHVPRAITIMVLREPFLTQMDARHAMSVMPKNIPVVMPNCVQGILK